MEDSREATGGPLAEGDSPEERLGLFREGSLVEVPELPSLRVYVSELCALEA